MGRSRWWRRWCVLGALLVAAALPATARTVLELDAAHQPVALQDWGDTWIDQRAHTHPRGVAEDLSLWWKPSDPAAIHRLAPGRALWIRFTVPPAPDAERWYLEVPSPSVGLVTLFSLDAAGVWTGQSAGDAVPVAEWPVPHRHPLLPVAVSAEEPRRYLVRIENPRLFSTPLAFVSESHLSQREQRASLLLGIYFGLAGLAALLALLSAVSLRDAAYAHSAVSIGLLGLTQASATGVAGLHLWPHLAAWNELAGVVLPVLAAGSTLSCITTTVSLGERSVHANQAAFALALASAPMALGAAVADPAWRYLLVIPYVVAAALASCGAAAWAARRGDRHGRWLLLAFAPMLLAAAWPLAHALGLAPLGFWTTHAMQVGTALAWPLLLVILMLRSQHRRENSRRLHGLDRMDPATGLINRYEFTERLVRMSARSQRLKYDSAVLVIVIANIEQLRREFDRRSSEEMPLHVAARLLSTAREIDSVGRLAEHRFGIMVEGPLSHEEAASIGPRVVARCLMPFKDRPLAWLPQIRVAQALVPLGDKPANAVIEQLETLLAGVPATNKRAVFTVPPEPRDPAMEVTTPIRMPRRVRGSA